MDTSTESTIPEFNTEEEARRRNKSEYGKKQERTLEEEAHQLGLSSWDRVDKWLKELESKNQNKKENNDA
jgi:hypothetical protein